ncbi:tetratricopeptide repeat protein [Neptunitalea lumnitzerae]|uniref:Uncharacterized protein n=1 Tax=Neptunitalea lumnitzerae TaxID=2965509 RepID=A0ABQ5MKT8_9FLAO|nr:hypothetical protein [Neptunitalea sp. Y10]GLB49989.1 hypothetical protein Y10_23570 [Neptunitalea sp. Y10]
MKIKTLLFICYVLFIQLSGAQEGEDVSQTDSLDVFFKYVQNLNDAIETNDQDFIIDNFDTNTIDKILSQSPDSTNSLYKRAITVGLKSFTHKLYTSISTGSYYDFINYSDGDTEDSYYALFRLFSEDTGINYHQYKISKQDSTYVINDVFILLSGEYLSATLGNTFRNSFVKNSDNDKNLYNKFIVLKNMGMDSKAYEVAKKIKDTTYLSKSFLILKAKAAATVSDDDYKQCLKDVLERFPSDPNLALLSLDYYYMDKDFNNLFRAIDQLENYTDDDFLRYLKGNYAYEIEEFHLAQESFEYIVDNYPTFLSAELMLIQTYDKLKNNKGVVTLLDDLISDGYSKDDLIDYVKTDITDFYKSKDFKSWKRKH